MKFKINGIRLLGLFIVIVILISAAVITVADIYSGGVYSGKSKDDFVIFVNVGQGDAAIIHSGDYTALIDAGTNKSAPKLYRTILASGIKSIDCLILTHPHSDHIGGAEYLLNKLDVDTVVYSNWLAEDEKEAEIAKSLQNKVSKLKIPAYAASQAMVINIGNFELTVLGCSSYNEDENCRSAVIMAKNGNYKFLFTGDAGESIEYNLLKQGINVKCDVLKVAHHGSRTANSSTFLKAASPKYAVISVSSGNRYNLPNNEVVKRLNKYCGKVLRTDEHGDIRFNIKDNILTLAE